jgi:hypothetical protein
VSPGQPIFRNLDQYGLTPHVWEDCYIAIEPSLRNLSEDIICNVTGPNQGRERLGQYNIAVALSQSGRSRSDVKRRASSIDEADFMYYSYDPEEVESRYEMQFNPVEPCWCFGTLKTDGGLTYGCLLSFEEWKLLENERRLMRATMPWTSTLGILNEEWFVRHLDRIESEHIIPPRREGPEVFPSVYQRVPRSESIVCLSPFVIARSWNASQGRGVTAVHLVSRAVMQLPASVEEILRSICSTPLRASDVETALVERECGVRLDQLLESGWIRVVEPFVAEKRGVLGPQRLGARGMFQLL